MGAYQDFRDGRWRYRKWITLADGIRQRISGTPDENTEQAAIDEERRHVEKARSIGRGDKIVMCVLDEGLDRRVELHLERMRSLHPNLPLTKPHAIRSLIITALGVIERGDSHQDSARMLRWLTSNAELAVYLGVSLSTVYWWGRKGVGPPRERGYKMRWYYRRDLVDKWVRSGVKETNKVTNTRITKGRKTTNA